MKHTVMDILWTIAQQWEACAESTCTNVRRQELEFLVDTMRQLYGEWVAEHWIKEQKRARL